MLKRIFSGILALLAVVAFASCKKDKDNEPRNPQQPTITACEMHYEAQATATTLALFKIQLQYFGDADTSVTNYSAVPATLWRSHTFSLLDMMGWKSSETYSQVPQVAGYSYSMKLDTASIIYKTVMQKMQDTTTMKDTAVVKQLVKYFYKTLTDSTSGIYFDIRMVEHLTYSNGTTADVAIAEKKFNLRGITQENLPWRILGMMVPNHYAGVLPNTSSQRILLFWLDLE